MIEKRFIFDPSIHHFKDAVTGKTYCEYNLDEVVDVLNDYENESVELKSEIKSLRLELHTHKHPLWSTREAERVVNELKLKNEQLSLICEKYEGFLKEKGHSIHEVIDYARDGSND